jgi:hypothetical protein
MVRLLLASCMTIVAAVTVLGQSSDELAAKYPVVSAYQVRPGILMTAKYADDGQVCEMTIEKRHYSAPREVDLSSNIPRRLIDQLTDDLVPESERGPATSRYLSDDSYVAGGVSYIKRDFEKVSIEIHGSTSESCNGGDEVVVIRWKKRACVVPKTTAVDSTKKNKISAR